MSKHAQSVSISLQPKDVAALDELADRLGLSRSRVVAEALRPVLRRYQGEPSLPGFLDHVDQLGANR